MPKQVKFWVYITCPVRITLREGQTLTHGHGVPTDEGHSWTRETWHFDGETVHATTETDACDCDGRTSHYATACFAVADAANGFVEQEEPFIAYPAWQVGQSSQRDYSAEAMGY